MRPLDGVGANRVDTHLEREELDRERLGTFDHRPFGGCIGCPKAIAIEACPMGLFVGDE
jgi:hypothetical protein